MGKLYLLLSLFTLSLASKGEEQDSTRNIQLSEIEIVSTVKEKGSLRQQPMSASRLTSKDIESKQIKSLKGITSLVPNVFMPDYGSKLTSAVYIRGIGSRINTPAIGLYVDDMPYVDKTSFDFTLFDIESIDVMKGPQATLYGLNAMGGIINVHTKSPMRHQGTDVRLGYASGDNHRNISLSHYQKVNDQFAFSAAGYYEGSDGFYKNSYTGKSVDDIQSGGGRIRGILRTSDKLKMELSAGYDYSDEGAYPYYYVGSLTDTESYADNKDKITNNREHSYRRGLFNTGFNIEYKNDNVILSSVTCYQNIKDRMYMDQDFLSTDIYSFSQKQRINTFNEELIIKSAKPSRWEWLNGVTFMTQSLHTDAPVTFYDKGKEWLQNTINSNMPKIIDMGITITNDDNLNMGGSFETPTQNAAFFHQSTFHITDKLSAIAGARLNYDHKRLEYDATSMLKYRFDMSAQMGASPIEITLNKEASAIYNGEVSDDYLHVLPKIAFKYDFDNSNNIYLSVSEGMRSGGYNVQMFSDILQSALKNDMMKQTQESLLEEMSKNPNVPEIAYMMVKNSIPVGDNPDVKTTVTYKPELAWNYEIGTHLTMLDRSLVIDASVFFMSTRDQQIARFTDSGLGRIMVNAGKSESYGLETSVRWHPTKPLNINVNYGYTHAVFTDYDGGNGKDYTDNYVPFVPAHTVNCEAAYTFNIKDSWLNGLTLAVNYTGNGKMYWTESNNAYQKFYSLAGARIEITTKYFDMTLWGRNLFNTKYNTFYFESMSRGFEQHGKPQQVGVDLKFSIN